MNVVEYDANVVLGYVLSRGISILDVTHYGMMPLLPVEGAALRVRLTEMHPPNESTVDLAIEHYLSGHGFAYMVAVVQRAIQIARTGNVDEAYAVFETYSLSETFRLKLDPLNMWFDDALTRGREQFERELVTNGVMPYQSDDEIYEMEVIAMNDNAAHVTSRDGECSRDIRYGTLLHDVGEPDFIHVLHNAPLVNAMLTPR